MAANKIVRFGPTPITNAVTNMLNPLTTTGGTGIAGTNTNTYIILRKMSIVNKTALAATVTMYIGATGASAAGTEYTPANLVIPANSSYVAPSLTRLDVADFLTAIASANTTLVFEGEGEIGIA